MVQRTRSSSIRLPVTKTELDGINEQARLAGFPSTTSYVRALIERDAGALASQPRGLRKAVAPVDVEAWQAARDEKRRTEAREHRRHLTALLPALAKLYQRPSDGGDEASHRQNDAVDSLERAIQMSPFRSWSRSALVDFLANLETKTTQRKAETGLYTVQDVIVALAGDVVDEDGITHSGEAGMTNKTLREKTSKMRPTADEEKRVCRVIKGDES